MTNREIKLELAKAMLRGGIKPGDTSLQELYEWVIEEPEVDVDMPKTDYDDKPVSDVVGWVMKNDYRGCGYGVRLERIFSENNIKTVGDLLRIGRTGFGRLREVGNGSIIRIDNALEELYGIKNWLKQLK